MSALLKLVKAFGINVEERHIKAVEEILPQVPRLVQQGVETVNNAVQNFDARLRAIETEQQTQLEQHRLRHEDLIARLERVEAFCERRFNGIETQIGELKDAGRNRSNDNASTGDGNNGRRNDHGKHGSDARSSNRRR